MDQNASGISVLPFDDSIENHFNAMNTIRKLCGTKEAEDEEAIDEIEMEQFNSRITFLREWKHYCYTPRNIRFSCEIEGQQAKYVIGEVNLSQFSAANVPKTERWSSGMRFSETSKDFVLYVGGHVWALDWCPSVHQQFDCHIKCEYLAVAAHPPESSYHKIGAPLTGRGVVQIWCILNTVKEEVSPHISKIKGRKSKKQVSEETDILPPKRPRGRPRKESLHDSERENQMIQATAVQLCNAKEEKPPPVKKARGRPSKKKDIKESLVDLDTENESVPALTNDISQVSSGFRALTEATRSTEANVLLKRCDTTVGSDDSKGDNQMVQATVVQSCFANENMPLPSKKARGRPKKRKPRKQQDTKECLVDLDTENEPVPVFDVDISQVSSESLALTEATRSTEEHAKISDADVVIDDSNREHQMVQVTSVQLCGAREKIPLQPKKARGRPKKQQGIKESSVESVPALAVDISQVSSGSLALTEATRSKDEHAKISDADVGIDDSNREHQMVQVTSVQLCGAREKIPLPPKKARGSPKKQKGIKESLVDSVPALAVDIPQVSSGFLALNEATRDTEELAKSCDTDVGLDDSNRENQMVQLAAEQLCSVNEKTPLPSKKARRPRKQKGLVDLDIQSEFLPALAADISQVSSEFFSLTEATRSAEEHAKSCDTDVGLDDSSSQNQIVQLTDVRLCNVKETKPLPLKKPRERPRKQTPRKQMDTKEPLVELDTENKSVSSLSVDISQVSSGFVALTEATRGTEEHAMIRNCDTDVSLETEILDQCSYKMPTRKRKRKSKTTAGYHADGISPLMLAQDDDRDSFVDVLQGHKGYGQDALASSLNLANNGSLEVSTSSFDPPTDVALPRVVLCLAHNGKVAWDVKWRPSTVSDVEHKHRMGYLAVLLGNGSLEVWEVPSPRAIEILFSSAKKEGTDPRFVKLDPVFRCSKLKSGDRHSIPLTVEWSTSSPHDLLLAGCHDGTVALWKFSASGSPQDTRPLLCFSADTLPIRALAWAPDESDEESANIVVTAGHGGIRFWDIRDPYRPLWDVNPVRRFIYSLDWLQNPRCVIMSFDDGTLRILSLSKAAYDVPATGKLFVGTQQQGLHSHFCSSFPIWSVQASRLTGQVVYCSADGFVHRFQLTSKAVDKDPSRNRAPHFLCGSLTEEGAALNVNTPLPNIPILMKKSLNECGETPRSIRGILSDLNQERRANDRTPEHEPLALCYDDDDDSSFHIGSGDKVPISKGKTTSKTSKKREPDPDSVQIDNLPKAKNQEEARTDVEVLPPKIIAMHRVRWNMNKGSERWVCYGGAAGIVRCQEISVSSIGERSLVKKGQLK